MKYLYAISKGEIFSLYIFAFLIPLNPKWYGFALVFIVVESIFKLKKITKVPVNKILNFKNPFIWLFIFYIFHVIGLLSSSNLGFATMDLGMKSTFVLFPLYFTLVRPKLDLTKLFQFFFYGCLFSLMFYGCVGLVSYFHDGLFPMGSAFSFWMHRGYYVTYLVLAFTFLFTEVIREQKLTLINIGVLLLLISGTFFTESKMGILIILVNAFLLFFYFLKGKIGWLKSSFTLVIICLLTLFIVSKMLSGNNRFSGALYNLKIERINITSTESTTARILMWETAFDLIRDNIILGVGTGDVKDELQKLNYEKGYIGVADSNLNAHNQFLNSWVALGIFGLISLLGVFVTLCITKEFDNMLFVRFLSFSLLFVFLTESFLEVQAGIIPFAFLVSSIGLSTKTQISRSR